MLRLIALAFLAAPRTASAIDANCTQTTNLSIYRCPQNSTDWYQSYTGIVDSLDGLARTAPSTFSVVGNAFSVGGSTFAVVAGSVGVRNSSPVTALHVLGSASFGPAAGRSTFSAVSNATTYSLTTSSGISLAAGPVNLGSGGFVRWPDGSISTSASTSGGGGLSATTDASISANWTFVSSVNVTGYGGNLWQMIASSEPLLSPSVSLTIPISSATYKISFAITQSTGDSTSAFGLIRFSNDGGGNYNYECSTVFRNATEVFYAGSSAAQYNAASNGAGSFVEGDWALCEAEFSVVPNYNSKVGIVSKCTENSDALATFSRTVCGGQYVGSSPPTSIQVRNQSGGFRGWVRLMQLKDTIR